MESKAKINDEDESKSEIIEILRKNFKLVHRNSVEDLSVVVGLSLEFGTTVINHVVLGTSVLSPSQKDSKKAECGLQTLKRGHIICAVDGVRVDSSNIAQHLAGGPVGSKVLVRARDNTTGHEYEIELIRQFAPFVEQMVRMEDTLTCANKEMSLKANPWKIIAKVRTLLSEIETHAVSLAKTASTHEQEMRAQAREMQGYICALEAEILGRSHRDPNGDDGESDGTTLSSPYALKALKSEGKVLVNRVAALEQENSILTRELASLRQEKVALEKEKSEASFVKHNRDQQAALENVNRQLQDLVAKLREKEVVSERERERTAGELSETKRKANALLAQKDEDLASCRKRIEALEKELEERISTAKDVSSRLASVEKAREALFREVQAAQQAKQLEESSRASLEHSFWRMGALEKENAMLSRETATIKKEKERMVDSLAAREAARAQLSEELKEARDKLTKQLQDLAAKERENEVALEREKGRAANELADTKRKANALLAKKEEELSTSRKRVDSAEKDSSRLKSEHANLENRTASLEKENTYLSKELKRTKEEHANLERDRSQLQVRVDTLIHDAAKTAERISSLEKDIGALKSARATIGQELKDAKMEIEKQKGVSMSVQRDLQTALDKSTKQLQELAAKEREVEAAWENDKQRASNELSETKRKANALIAKQEEELVKCRQRLDAAEKEVVRLKSEGNALESRLTAFEKENGELLRELKRSKEENANLEREKAQLHGRVDGLMNDGKKLSEKTAALEREIESKKQELEGTKLLNDKHKSSSTVIQKDLQAALDKAAKQQQEFAAREREKDALAKSERERSANEIAETKRKANMLLAKKEEERAQLQSRVDAMSNDAAKMAEKISVLEKVAETQKSAHVSLGNEVKEARVENEKLKAASMAMQKDLQGALDKATKQLQAFATKEREQEAAGKSERERVAHELSETKRKANALLAQKEEELAGIRNILQNTEKENSRLKQELEKAAQSLNTLERERSSLQAQVDNLSKEVKKVTEVANIEKSSALAELAEVKCKSNAMLSQKDADIASARASLKISEKKKENAAVDMTALLARVEIIEQQNSVLVSENNKLKDEIRKLNEERSNLQDTVDSLIMGLDTKQMRASNSSPSPEDRCAKRSSATMKGPPLKALINDSEDDGGSIEQEGKDASECFESLRVQLKEAKLARDTAYKTMDTAIEEAHVQQTAAEKRQQDLQNQIARLEAALRDSISEKNAAENKLMLYAKERGDLDDERMQALRQAEDYQKKIDECLDEIHEGNENVLALRRSLAASQQCAEDLEITVKNSEKNLQECISNCRLKETQIRNLSANFLATQNRLEGALNAANDEIRAAAAKAGEDAVKISELEQELQDAVAKVRQQEAQLHELSEVLMESQLRWEGELNVVNSKLLDSEQARAQAEHRSNLAEEARNQSQVATREWEGRASDLNAKLQHALQQDEENLRRLQEQDDNITRLLQIEKKRLETIVEQRTAIKALEEKERTLGSQVNELRRLLRLAEEREESHLRNAEDLVKFAQDRENAILAESRSELELLRQQLNSTEAQLDQLSSENDRAKAELNRVKKDRAPWPTAIVGNHTNRARPNVLTGSEIDRLYMQLEAAERLAAERTEQVRQLEVELGYRDEADVPQMSGPDMDGHHADGDASHPRPISIRSSGSGTGGRPVSGLTSPAAADTSARRGEAGGTAVGGGGWLRFGVSPPVESDPAGRSGRATSSGRDSGRPVRA